METIKKIIDYPISTLASNSLTRPIISWIRNDPILKYTLLSYTTPLVFSTTASWGSKLRDKIGEGFTEFMSPNIQIDKGTDPSELKDNYIKYTNTKIPTYDVIKAKNVLPDRFKHDGKPAAKVTEIEAKSGWDENSWLKKKQERNGGIYTSDVNKYIDYLKANPDDKKRYKNLRKLKHAFENDKTLLGLGGLGDFGNWERLGNWGWNKKYVNSELMDAEKKLLNTKF